MGSLKSMSVVCRVVDIGRECGRSTSTICTILKQTDQIMSITPTKGTGIISKRGSSVTEEIERLLLLLPGMYNVLHERPSRLR